MKFKRYILIGTLFITISILFRLYIYSDCKDFYYEYTSFKSICESNLNQDSLIVHTSNKRLSNKWPVDHSYIASGNILRRMQKLIGYKLAKNIDYGEFGYLLYGCIVQGYSETKINHYDNILFSNNFKMHRLDQCSYGLAAIELYKRTKNTKYKVFADNIFSFILESNLKNNIILYNNDRYQFVDGIGLIIPFIIEYGKAFDNEQAFKIAYDTLNDFIIYGTDLQTGLPCKGYKLDNKVKVGVSNWGRGCGWYALALSFINEDFLTIESRKRTELFNKTLIEISDDQLYMQYIERDGKPDMSATIPIVLYLLKRKLIHNPLIVVNNIKQYIDCHGNVKYNSPGFQYNTGVKEYMDHDMSQGCYLLLMNEINE